MTQLNYATLIPGGNIVYKERIGNTYDIIRSEIKNYVDHVGLEELDIWVDDEGALNNLEPSAIIKNQYSQIITNQDIILFGPVVFTSHDGMGNTISLNEEAQKVLNRFEPSKLGNGKDIWLYINF